MSDALDSPLTSRVPAAPSFDDELRIAVIDGNPSGTAKKQVKTITKAQLQAFIDSRIPEIPEPPPPYAPTVLNLGNLEGIIDIDQEDADIQYCNITNDITFAINPMPSTEGKSFELWGRCVNTLGSTVVLGAPKPNSLPSEDSITLAQNEFFYARYHYMFDQWNITVLTTGSDYIP